jgi:hypothetical protein
VYDDVCLPSCVVMKSAASLTRRSHRVRTNDSFFRSADGDDDDGDDIVDDDDDEVDVSRPSQSMRTSL